MKITDRTDSTLTLTDSQADKAIALYGLALLLAGFAVVMAWQGNWGLVAPPLAIAGAGLVYLYLTRIRTVLHFDKAADKITLDVIKRSGIER